jgi:hypothetical protein
MKTPVQEAIAAITRELMKADGNRLGGLKMEMEMETEGPEGEEMPEECGACAEGTCEDPEHLSDEDMGGLLASVEG